MHARGFAGLLSRMQEQRKHEPTTEQLPRIDRAGARRLIASAGPDVGRDGGHQWGGAARSWFIKTSSWHAIVLYGAVLAGVMTASLEGPQHAWSSGGLLESPPDSGAGGKEFTMMKKMSAAGVAAVMIASQAMAGDAVQWRVEDGGNGHWYQRTEANCWSEADPAARAQGCHLASVLTEGEAQFCTQFVLSESDGITVAIGGFRTSTSDLYLGWRWTTDEAFIPGSLTWMSGNPGCCGSDEYFLGINRVGHIGDLRDCPGLVGAILEWSADCNSDGIVDYGQCRNGTLPDYHGNNLPDCCERGEACVVGHYPVQWIVEDGGNWHW